MRARLPRRTSSGDSPGSNAGCGLKRTIGMGIAAEADDSPGSNAGCGLKLVAAAVAAKVDLIHPAAMPGAD